MVSVKAFIYITKYCSLEYMRPSNQIMVSQQEANKQTCVELHNVVLA